MRWRVPRSSPTSGLTTTSGEPKQLMASSNSSISALTDARSVADASWLSSIAVSQPPRSSIRVALAVFSRKRVATSAVSTVDQSAGLRAPVGGHPLRPGGVGVGFRSGSHVAHRLAGSNRFGKRRSPPIATCPTGYRRAPVCARRSGDFVAAFDLRARRPHPAQLGGSAGGVKAQPPTAFGVLRELLIDQLVDPAAQQEPQRSA